MKITLLEHEDNSVDFADQLKKGACHYVSVAMPGFTNASAIMLGIGFDTPSRNDFMQTINHKRETGTFYPRANFTLLPSPYASYGGMDKNEYNDGDYPEETVIAHILDAFKANSVYIKSDTIYFDFRNLCVSEDHYLSCLKLAVEQLGEESCPKIVTYKPK